MPRSIFTGRSTQSSRAGFGGRSIFPARLAVLLQTLDYANLSAALADGSNLTVGDTITVGGLRGRGDTFEVTSSAAETDGGTVFMFDEDRSQTSELFTNTNFKNQQSLPHDNISWRDFEIAYGPDPKDRVEARNLRDQNHVDDEPLQSFVDFKNGTFGGLGTFWINRLSGRTSWARDKNEVFYHYATSDRRLERQNVGSSVDVRWWGAERDTLVNNSPELEWAAIVAGRLYEQNNPTWAYVDVPGTFYYRESPRLPEGVRFRGTGSLDHDSDMPSEYQDDFTRGTLRLLPGEALYYKKNGYSRGTDPDLQRAKDASGARQFISIGNSVFPNDTPDNKIGAVDLKIDGNVRNNMQVFNNPSNYNGGELEQWLQDSGDWSGIYTKSTDEWEYQSQWLSVELEDVAIVDQGASGIAMGNFPDSLPDVQTTGQILIRDTRRNHLLYGLQSRGVIDGLTLEGQYWGGNPLHDPRGDAQPPTFTNLTVQDIYRGQYMTNALIAARGGGMTIDGFNIDMEPPADKQSDGASVSIFAVEDRGNEFKNGTIHLNDEKGSQLFVQRSLVTDGSGVEGTTLLKNITIVDHGTAGSIYLAQRATRDFRMENVTYELAEGVDNTKRNATLMGVELRVPGSGEVTPPHAYRTFHKDFVYERKTEETFGGGAAIDNDSVFPQDVFFVGGSIQNQPEFRRFTEVKNINPDTRWVTVKNARWFLNDFTFTSQTNTGTNGKQWHKQFSPESEKLPGRQGNPDASISGMVRFRNCTDASGRESDQVGQSYTATSADESNGYALIPTNLLSRAWERSVTANASYNVTSVEVANQDGTLRGKTSGNQLEPYLKVSVDGTITQGDTFDWTARVTPLDAYSTTGLFVARLVENKSLTSGSGPWTHDLRGTAATQESRDPIVYTASSDDTNVATVNVPTGNVEIEQDSEPTQRPNGNALVAGDIWRDTSDSGISQYHRWNGSAFEDESQGSFAVYVQSSAPSSPSTGDYWGEKKNVAIKRIKKYDGSSWNYVVPDQHTLEITEQSTGTATITVDAEIPGVGTASTSFDVTIQ